MLGDQKPDTSQVATDLVRQKLTHTTLDTGRVARLLLGTLPADTRLQRLKWFTGRATPVEFFFAVRSWRSLVLRRGCLKDASCHPVYQCNHTLPIQDLFADHPEMSTMSWQWERRYLFDTTSVLGDHI